MNAVDLINKYVVPEQRDNVFVAGILNDDKKCFKSWYHVHLDEEIEDDKEYCLMFSNNKDGS